MAVQSFSDILAQHAARYPHMEPQDYGKLAFQSEFGPEHILAAPEVLAAYLASEMQEAGSGALPEDIGGRLCRLHLDASWPDCAPALVAQLMTITAQAIHGTQEGLEQKLALLEDLPVPGMQEWLARWRSLGCPAVHHSEAYRAQYHPHYRLLLRDFAAFFPVFLKAAQLQQADLPSVLAIDGRCGSGKSTLARLLSRLFGCTVLHMDDFYLPPQYRSPDWRQVPAGNMDLQRLMVEVLLPLRQRQPAAYRAYSCSQGQYLPPVPLSGASLIVLEGSYSLHPILRSQLDAAVFLTCSKDTQQARLMDREGGRIEAFQNTWIPLEEQYIRLCTPDRTADLLLDTSGLDGLPSFPPDTAS